MAAITAVGTALASTTNASSYVTASFTPTASRLIFVFCAVTDATPTSPTLTDTSNSNGLTFTQVTRAHKINTSNSTQEGELYLFVANQATPGAPAAMTLTLGGVTGASGCVIMPGEVASLTRVGTSAVRQFATAPEVQGGTAPAPVFASSALTGNPTAFGVQVSVGSGATPPTNWTERADVTYSTPTTGGEWSSRDSGFTGTTITLGGTGNGPCAGISVEFDTSASSISGTLATTLDDATLAASGTQTLSGSLATTFDGATLAATGTVTAPAITGTLATTLTGATLAGSGTLKINGTLAATLNGAAFAASGVQKIKGTLASTLAGATVAASGRLALPGALASTLDGVTLTSAGKVAITGSLNTTLDGATLAASGRAAFAGVLAVALDGAALVATGWSGFPRDLTLTGAQVGPRATGTTVRPLLAATLNAPRISGQREA